VHGPTLPIPARVKPENPKLAIMGKIRARAQKCGSLLIY